MTVSQGSFVRLRPAEWLLERPWWEVEGSELGRWHRERKEDDQSLSPAAAKEESVQLQTEEPCVRNGMWVVEVWPPNWWTLVAVKRSALVITDGVLVDSELEQHAGSPRMAAVHERRRVY